MGGLVNIDVGGMAKGITDLLQSKIPTPLDKNTQMELQAQIETQLISATAQSDQVQGAIDLQDNASKSFYHSGYRPAIMWLCALSLFVDIIIRPILPLLNHALVLPPMDPIMRPLLCGLLGVGHITQSLEKIIGT